MTENASPPPAAAPTEVVAATAASTPERVIRRTWTQRGFWVATVHPQYGELPRGRIRIVPGGWSWTDPDGNHGRVSGDYLDAETTLLDATAELDLPDPEYPTAEDIAEQAVAGSTQATRPQPDPRYLAEQASSHPAVDAGGERRTAAPTAAVARAAAPHPGRAR